MTSFRGSINAFGAPGIPPKWTRGNKDGIGTSYSADSKIWFTVWRGTLTELYYPTVDRPQLRDMEYLVSDGSTFFHEEKRQLNTEVERLERRDLGYRVVSSDPAGRYRIRKEIISDSSLTLYIAAHKVRSIKGPSRQELTTLRDMRSTLGWRRCGEQCVCCKGGQSRAFRCREKWYVARNVRDSTVQETVVRLCGSK